MGQRLHSQRVAELGQGADSFHSKLSLFLDAGLQRQPGPRVWQTQSPQRRMEVVDKVGDLESQDLLKIQTSSLPLKLVNTSGPQSPCSQNLFLL